MLKNEDEQSTYAKRAYLNYRKSYGQDAINTVRRSISSLRTSMDESSQSQNQKSAPQPYINLKSSTKYHKQGQICLANKLRANTSLAVAEPTIEDSRLSASNTQQSNVPLNKRAQGKLLPAL